MNFLARAVLAATFCVLLISAAADARDRVVLPTEAPVPEVRSQQAREADKQSAPADATKQPKDALPATGAPVPEARPIGTSNDRQTSTDAPGLGGRGRTLGPQFDEKLERAEAACQDRLRALDVVFEPRPALADPLGCSVPFPLGVTRLGKDVALEPEAVLNCQMAEAAARFARSVISPAAQTTYGATLKSIANASAYVCRPRNGSSKLSEHAFGNALDMARFVLADGTAIDVQATTEPKAQGFLSQIRKAACGPFKTVLGPGSDADHATHFHVDLAYRRNGGTFCQ